MRARTAAVALTLAALLAGCGDDAEQDPTVQPPASSSPSPSRTPEPCESAPPTQEPRGTSTDLTQKPVVDPGEGAPPCGLVVRDVVVGTGAEVVQGAQVEVKYVGAFYETGEEFDSSWSVSPEQTLPFEAGGGSLIPGFDQGVLGMKEGGRREIVIPSDLAYGPTGSGPIPGGATLVFVIDAVTVQAP